MEIKYILLFIGLYFIGNLLFTKNLLISIKNTNNKPKGKFYFLMILLSMMFGCIWIAYYNIKNLLKNG